MKVRVLLVAFLQALAGGLYWAGTPVPPAVPVASVAAGGDFTLESADGPLRLADLRGKVVLLFFGYTYCPDICPTSLAATAAGLKRLTPAERAQVAVVFVSVDPERDTPARLKEYAAFFDPAIRGVTAAPAVIAEVATRYGAVYRRQDMATAGGSYVIDHSATTYVIDRSGRLSGEIAHAAPPDAVAGEIRRRLAP